MKILKLFYSEQYMKMVVTISQVKELFLFYLKLSIVQDHTEVGDRYCLCQRVYTGEFMIGKFFSYFLFKFLFISM